MKRWVWSVISWKYSTSFSVFVSHVTPSHSSIVHIKLKKMFVTYRQSRKVMSKMYEYLRFVRSNFMVIFYTNLIFLFKFLVESTKAIHMTSSLIYKEQQLYSSHELNAIQFKQKWLQVERSNLSSHNIKCKRSVSD